MRKKRRPLDWVIQPAAWDGTQGPYQLNPDDGTAGYSNSELIVIPLTVHPGSTGAAPGGISFASIPEIEQTVVAVRGVILYGMGFIDNDAIPAFHRFIRLEMRIIKTMQENFTGIPLLETEQQYDTSDHVVANDDFLWNHIDVGNMASSRWDDAPDSQIWQTPQRVDVNVRVQRRLAPREVLALVLHASCNPAIPFNGGELTTTNLNATIWVEPYLRTLVRTNT